MVDDLGSPPPGYRLLSDVVDIGRARFGASPALVSTAATWSFEELGERTDAVAAGLLRLGLEAREHVGHVMENSTEGVAAFFGAVRAGGVLVPLNSRLTAEEIAYEVARADISTVVVSPTMLHLLSELGTHTSSVRRLVVVAPIGERPELPAEVDGVPVVTVDIASAPSALPEVDADPDDVAVMWYTSGTTGRPKPTEHTHASTVAAMAAWADAWGLESGDRLINQNLFHVATLCYLGGPLVVGAASVLVGPFSLADRITEIERLQVTADINGIVFLSLLDHHPDQFRRSSMASLRKLGWGGAPMDSAMLARTVDRFSWVEQWYQCWAQTESGSGGSCLRGDDFFTHRNSIGTPIACVEEMKVVAADGQKDGIGELVLRGPTVMRGYYRDPESTATTIRDGWLHTGDLASVDHDGFVTLRGRGRDTIKRGGENVLPADIERVVCEFPGVASCTVVGLPDSVMTEVPVAFVIAREGSHLDEQSMREHLARHLADFKRPAHVVTVQEFPRNSNGKILRKELVRSVRHLSR